MFLLFLAAVASRSTENIPTQFLGRWESAASECKILLDDKTDQSFFVVEPKKVWTFEAEDKIEKIRLLSSRDLVADVIFISEGIETPDKAKLTLISPNRLAVRFGEGWSLAIYVRCPRSK